MKYTLNPFWPGVLYRIKIQVMGVDGGIPSINDNYIRSKGVINDLVKLKDWIKIRKNVEKALIYDLFYFLDIENILFPL